MSYRSRLTLWIIVQFLPNMQSYIVGRFRNKSDAEGHLVILKRLIPKAQFQVMFDPPPIPRRVKPWPQSDREPLPHGADPAKSPDAPHGHRAASP
jgi:hypothetical protein